MNGEDSSSLSSTTLPISATEVSGVDLVPRENGINAWKKPQISVEEVDIHEGDVVLSSITTPSSTLEPNRVDNVSTSKHSTNLSITNKHGIHIYPKTPPANFKFKSPSTKFDDHPSGRYEDQEEWYNEDSNSTKARIGGVKREDVSLKVTLATSHRSHSLPMGIKLEDNKRISSNSDETVESEGGSPIEKRKAVRRLEHLLHQERLDSAGSDFSPPDTSDDSSSEGTCDVDKMGTVDIPESGLEQEDDIFTDIELTDMQEQADMKLVNWACNDFVPACHQLLSRCCECGRSTQIKSANVQADLRSLSNTITFFCTEQQQRLSQVFQLRPIKTRGKSQLSNTQTFPRPLKNIVEKSADEAGGDRSYAVKVLRSASQSLIAPLIVEASKREGFTPNLHQTIIKALQKIAWKVEACVSFSNPNQLVEIHAKIFDAQHVKDVRELMIQALPPAGPNLRTVQPPPVKKRKASLPNVTSDFSPVVPIRRGQSVKEMKTGLETNLTPLTLDLQSIGEQDADYDDDDDEDDVWKEDGIEDSVQDHKVNSADVLVETKDGDVNGYSKKETGVERIVEEGSTVRQSPLERSREGTPNLPRRERFATEGEADLLNKSQLPRSSNFGGSIPNLERDDINGSLEGLNGSGTNTRSEHYFRPRAFRRTTISLSKKEVQKLGLTVAKRVDESILDDIRVQREQEAKHRRSCRQNQRGSKSEEKPPRTRTIDGEKVPGQILELEVRDPEHSHGIDSVEDMEKVGDRLHNTLTKHFDRYRSVSMSGIIDCDTDSLPDHPSLTPDPSTSDRDSDTFSPQPNQRLTLVPNRDNKRPLYCKVTPTHVTESCSVTDSLPVLPNFQQSYTPIKRGTEVPKSSSGEWVMVDAEKRKKSMRGRAKESVKKSLSNSGRLAHRLLKTGLSLRNSSTSKQLSQKMSKSLSAADLLDDSTPVHPQQSTGGNRPTSRMSLSITSSTPSTSYDASTLPTRHKRMNTFARMIGRKSKSSRSRSFGRSDSSDHSSWSHDDEFHSGDRSFAESIETVSSYAIHPMAVESKSLS